MALPLPVVAEEPGDPQAEQTDGGRIGETSGGASSSSILSTASSRAAPSVINPDKNLRRVGCIQSYASRRCFTRATVTTPSPISYIER